MLCSVHLNTCFLAAAAAKSLQSCSTLWDPIDSSPPGSPVPGILQARTLEWVAISFSNAWKCKVRVKLLSPVWLLATPWTAAYQAPPSMGFSRQEYWSGCHCLLFSFASHVQFFATPQTPAHQASLSLTVSRSLPTFMSIDSVMPFNHLFLCCPLLTLASIFPSIRVFSNVCVCGLLRWISWIFNKRNPLPFTFGDCMICMIVPRVQCPD